MSAENHKTEPPKPPAKPKPATKPKTKRKVRKMAKPPEPVKDPDAKPKPKRKPQRTKVAGWEKGTVRSACFYVQDGYHQAVNVAASALRVSKGIVVERAVLAYLKEHPNLEGVRPALAAVIGDEWNQENGQGDASGGSDG